MKIISYHKIDRDHWRTQSEFRNWCIENSINAKWINGYRKPQNSISDMLDDIPMAQRRALNCQVWEIENEEDAVAAKLAWGK